MFFLTFQGPLEPFGCVRLIGGSCPERVKNRLQAHQPSCKIPKGSKSRAMEIPMTSKSQAVKIPTGNKSREKNTPQEEVDHSS